MTNLGLARDAIWRLCVAAPTAQYDSQGQVRTLSGRRPWIKIKKMRSSRERAEYYFGLSGLNALNWCVTRGDALRFASRLLLAFISRAVGASTQLEVDRVILKM